MLHAYLCWKYTKFLWILAQQYKINCSSRTPRRVSSLKIIPFFFFRRHSQLHAIRFVACISQINYLSTCVTWANGIFGWPCPLSHRHTHRGAPQNSMLLRPSYARWLVFGLSLILRLRYRAVNAAAPNERTVRFVIQTTNCLAEWDLQMTQSYHILLCSCGIHIDTIRTYGCRTYNVVVSYA